MQRSFRGTGIWGRFALATAAATLVPATAAAAEPITFSAPTNHAVGITPYSVTTGDLNADGGLDLVVPNRNSNTVSVLLGDGAGGFSAADHFAAGTGSVGVAIGQFNADSNRDLAVTDFDANAVSILFGDGTGRFSAPTSFAAGEGALAVAAGDFNGNGNADLAVANFFANNVSILLGDGTGGFGAPINLPVGAIPQSVTTGDFNADTDLDLAVVNSGDNDVTILLGDGAGGFAAAGDFAVESSPVSVATGEFGGGGATDLAVANSGSSSVSVLLGDGTGGFGAGTSFATGGFPPSVAVSDLDGDSNDDITVPNSGDANISVLLGNGAGSFATQATFDVGTVPYGVASGNFDADGRTDLAVANSGSNNVSVLLQQGTSSGPQTTIDIGPAAGSSTSSDDPHFEFSASEPDSSFECRIVPAAFGPCSSPLDLTDVAEGSRTFEVRATDPAGNVDDTPATRSWTIDKTDPETQIDAGPAAGSTTGDNDPHFEFSGTPAGDVDHFECRVVPAAFASCTSPLDLLDVADGGRTVEVRACDAVDNCDASPASRSWTIDTADPETQIDSGPAAGSATSDDDPHFEFSANQAGATFECRVLPTAFAPCGSPLDLSNLAEGNRTFEVRATDAAGNVDDTPATRSWTIDKTPPETQIDAGPAAGVTSQSNDPRFEFSASEAGSTFECRIAPAAFAPCTSPLDYLDLPDAGQTFEVRATDAAGNVDPSPASRSWTIDAIPPETMITDHPPRKMRTSKRKVEVEFGFESDTPGASFECRLDGAALTECESPVEYKVKDGKHTFEVRALAGGLIDPTPARYSFTVVRR